MNFNPETRMKQIVVENPGAARVFEEVGVDFCCGGDKSLKDACAHADVSLEEVLGRLRDNKTAIGARGVNWVNSPLSGLTQHIREKHHRYVREAIPRVRALLEKVKAKHGQNHPEIGEIENLFESLSHEMIMHMQKEEQILFPYIEGLERSTKGEGTLEPPFFVSVRNPIHAMMKEHDSAGSLVKQIREASSGYTPPADACSSYQALYVNLREFEADLHQHVHLENNILFPRAVEMEAAIA